jgi:hypothetical protein
MQVSYHKVNEPCGQVFTWLLLNKIEKRVKSHDYRQREAKLTKPLFP